MVHQVSYHITHQGVEGLTAVDLFVSLLDRSEVAGGRLVQQHEVTHSWAGENRTEDTTEQAGDLSGRPGYRLERPLRSGYWEGGGAGPVIRLDTSATSLPTVKSDGTCDLESRDRLASSGQVSGLSLTEIFSDFPSSLASTPSWDVRCM